MTKTTALSRLWRLLEQGPGLTAVEREWRDWLGPDIDVARPFFRPEEALAESYPCPGGGEDCPRRIVEHAPDDVVAVCSNSPRRCETLKLQKKDRVVHRLDVGKFAAAVAESLGVATTEPRAALQEPGVWLLGTVSGGGLAALPVLFAAPVAAPETWSVEVLLARYAARHALLVPRGLPPSTGALFTARGWRTVACVDLLEPGPNGVLVARQPLRETLADGLVAPATPPVVAVEPARAIVYSNADPKGRPIPAEEYARLSSSPPNVDVFVNGMSHKRDGKKRVGGEYSTFSLTAAEWTMLIRYVQRAADGLEPCRARDVGISSVGDGSMSDPQTFKTMRSKVDIKPWANRQHFCLFKQQRSFHGGESSYSFTPDRGASYLIIAPPPAVK